MKQKMLLLQYILHQDKNSMIYEVLMATLENPVKNDFVSECQRYIQHLGIGMSFEEIRRISKYTFTKLVKQKVADAGFKYLMTEKNKQSKIMDIKYNNLKIQEYLLDGNRNTELSKLIFKGRSKTLDIKTQKKWKYEDSNCVGCGEKLETVEEILACSGLSENSEQEPTLAYENIFSDNIQEVIKVAIGLKKKLKARKKIIDDKG